jgi:multidrug efflux system membrane fusion protein
MFVYSLGYVISKIKKYPHLLVMQVIQRNKIMTTSSVGKTPTNLTFQSDTGSSRSKWAAVFSAVAIIGWMGSGYIFPSSSATPDLTTDEVQVRTVAARNSMAEDVVTFISAQGQTKPVRRAEIKATAGGEIISIEASLGSSLSKGDVIIRLEDTALKARLDEARSDLSRADRDLKNAQELLSRGASTIDILAQAKVSQADANATFIQAKRDYENTVLRSPFDGILDRIKIEEGETITPSSEVGVIIDVSSLIIRLNIPQQDRSRIIAGQQVEATLITGQVAKGTIRHVSLESDQATRTFRVEVAIQNPDSEIAAGLSTSVQIPLETISAHRVTPAALTLDASGQLGVKGLDAENRVVFYPVEIAKSDTLGTWVSGLPDQLNIIVLGQGFVATGDIVEPQFEERQTDEVLQ